jgi:hypothetical protein
MMHTEPPNAPLIGRKAEPSTASDQQSTLYSRLGDYRVSPRAPRRICSAFLPECFCRGQAERCYPGSPVGISNNFMERQCILAGKLSPVQRLINSPRCTLVLATIGYLHGRQGADDLLGRSRSSRYALAPVEIPDSRQDESTTWTVVATIGYLHGRQGVSGGSGTAQ